MRVLVIEDDATTRQSIEMMLKKEQWVVDATHLGEDGLELAKLYEYDILVLDLVLPDMDGLDIVRQLRAGRIETPVLILSGLNEPDRKVSGLGSGADDYLTKPFNQTELVARIHAIVRRSKGHAQSVVSVGKMKIHLDTHMVTINDVPVHLTVKEFGILELLALRKGTTLAKEQFLSHLYNGIDEPELKIIDVFICKLRKKLADLSKGENYIDTVWGRGYVLRDPDFGVSSPPDLPESASLDSTPDRSDSTLPA